MHSKESFSFSKKTKLIFIFAFITLFLILYVIRLFSLQILNGDQYRSQSQRISSQVTIIPAQRGEIFDRNANLPMVINTESFAVFFFFF